MKKLSKVFALMLIFAIVFTSSASAEEIAAPEFSDLDETHWAYEGINKLVGEGIIIGYPDGTFKPEGNITRAELVKIVNMVFEFTEIEEATDFTDVKAEDWFFDNVLIAQQAGYIVGYPDGTFKPNGLITREEFCKILDVINNFVELPLSTLPADEVSPWAVEFVTRVISNRIMLLDENNNFRALEKATRAEVCDTLAKFIIEDAEGKFPSPGGSSGGSDSDDELTKEELYETMDRVIDRLNTRVIPEISTKAQEQVVEDIILNMEKYQENNDHDYEEAAQKAYDKYKLMSEDEQEELKYKIQLHNITQDLLDLKKFFFPDIEL
jgi:hypothetical protein